MFELMSRAREDPQADEAKTDDHVDADLQGSQKSWKSRDYTANDEED